MLFNSTYVLQFHLCEGGPCLFLSIHAWSYFAETLLHWAVSSYFQYGTAIANGWAWWYRALLPHTRSITAYILNYISSRYLINYSFQTCISMEGRTHVMMIPIYLEVRSSKVIQHPQWYHPPICIPAQSTWTAVEKEFNRGKPKTPTYTQEEFRFPLSRARDFKSPHSLSSASSVKTVQRLFGVPMIFLPTTYYSQMLKKKQPNKTTGNSNHFDIQKCLPQNWNLITGPPLLPLPIYHPFPPTPMDPLNPPS